MKLVKVLMSSAAIAMFAHTAQAADLYTPAPVAPAAYDWTGFYGGVGLGAAINDSKVSNSTGGDFSGLSYSDQYENSLSADDSGFTGGGIFGYNWQSGNFVFGLETDINFADLDGSADLAYACVDTCSADLESSLSHSVDWFGTMRGRVGFAADRLFIYGTGGLAYGKVKSSASLIEDAGQFDWSGSKSGVEVGWTAGAGLDYAMSDSFVLGVQYLYVDLGSQNFDMPEAGDSPFTMSGSSDTAFSVIRGTASIRF